jgi:hypothetical protein
MAKASVSHAEGGPRQGRDLSSIAQPAFNPKAVDKVFGWLDIHKNLSTSVAAWGEFDSGGLLEKSHESVCNSAIGKAAIIGARPTADHSAANAVRYFDWFFNRSYAADYVMRPSDDFGRTRGFALLGGLPSNLLVSILITARQWREHKGLIDLMFRLVDEVGCPEDLAFALIFSTSFTGIATNSNHYPLQPGNTEYLRNFIERRIVGTLARPLTESSDYRTICQMWGEVNYAPHIFDGLAKLAKKTVKREEVVIINPFAVKKASVYGSTQVTTAELMRIAPSIINHYYPETEEKQRAA